MEMRGPQYQLPGSPPSVFGRARAWVAQSLVMAAGAIALVLAAMFGLVVLAVAAVLVLVLAAAGLVAYFVLRRRLRKHLAAMAGGLGPPRGGGRQNVRVIVHPPGE